MRESNTIPDFWSILLAMLMMQSAAATADVKITPLGSQEGEFCALDRALILEDPDGTRLLYDPGRTVAGALDPRLGEIDAVLVSHMHADHVGDRHISAPGNADCGSTSYPVSAPPSTNAVNIAYAKQAKIITGSEMPSFFSARLKALGGDPKNSELVRFGASRQVGGITLTTVPAAHSNGITGNIIGGNLGATLTAAGLTAYAGPPTGYVIQFSNGLVAYLSGDTGVTAEQETVVRDQYQARLVVINIGDTFTTGPTEAAWVVNNLIMPESVIVSHANQHSTQGGIVIAGTRVDQFSKLSIMPVHVPLSGRTMTFDGNGMCVTGC
jgi:L-ascorbate metabolism protein UlaG (beta-lactamase superfamily)